MSLFGSSFKQQQSEFNVPVYEGYVDPSFTGIQEINVEASAQAYALESALYIADVFIEESVMENAANADVLMESVVKDSFEKIKKALKDFWAKVKAWFVQVKNYLTALFLSGKKLVEKFKKELNESKKGFEYKGFHWTLSKGAGEVTDLLQKIEQFVEDTTGAAIHEIDTAAKLTATMSDKAPKEDVDSSEDNNKLAELVGGSRKDMIEDLQKAFRNGEDAKDTFEDFSGNSKSELIELVRGGEKTLADLKKNEKSTDKGFQRTLATIQRAEKMAGAAKAEGEDATKRRAQIVTATTRLYSVAKEAISYMTAATGVEVSASKAAISSSTSVLRSYISYRPKKEGFGSDEFESNNSDSLLENALKML